MATKIASSFIVSIIFTIVEVSIDINNATSLNLVN